MNKTAIDVLLVALIFLLMYLASFIYNRMERRKAIKQYLYNKYDVYLSVLEKQYNQLEIDLKLGSIEQEIYDKKCKEIADKLILVKENYKKEYKQLIG